MRGFLFIPACLYAINCFAGVPDPPEIPDRLDSVVVKSYVAGRSTPVAGTNLSRVELRRSAPSSSLPQALALQPSVVSTSEGGTGLGYTQLRVRGVSGYQTNVTLNGITLNDAESQEVFWVNIPGLTGMLGSVQLQRGLGTSSAGPGAFGASVNMNSASAGIPYDRYEYSYGSYDTRVLMLSGATGLSRHGFYAETAYTRQKTDGYMDNADADVRTYYGVYGWMTARNALRLVILRGKQKSGITWNGVPLEMYKVNRRYNSSMGDTDNYRQLHLQLNYSHQFGRGLVSSTTLNYSDGYGYYEIGGARDVLDNGLWVLRSDLQYANEGLELKAGIYLSRFDGLHYGEYYSNDALKQEADAWVRSEWKVSEPLSLYADVQYRTIGHDMIGPDEYGQFLDYALTWNFFNPRAGLTLNLSDHAKAFGSVAWGHREPARADLQASPAVRPEKMADFEFGTSYESCGFSASANVYLMEYRDMLLETGRLNAGGYAIKDNVDRGWRRGVELCSSWRASDRLSLSGNLACSVNRYRCPDGTLPILLSPSAVATGIIDYKPAANTSLRYNIKYVGSQYWDNTGCRQREVPGYCVSDVSVSHKIDLGLLGLLEISGFVNNLFNHDYYAYAWVYRSPQEDGSWYQEEGLFPQPPINFIVKASLTF